MRLLLRGAEGLALLICLGFLYLLASWIQRLWRSAGQACKRSIHTFGAPWFAGYCRRHGALLIKIGQVVASRPDLLPLPYVDACANLRDKAPARTFAIVASALKRAYEGRPEEHFAHIEEQPLAAASFGQVHRARLHDGTAVAIKVQYPDLGPRVAMDLALLSLGLRLFALVTPGWPVHIFYEEIARTSREEQDYLCEATAAERLRPLLARRRVEVPRVFFEHTRDTVLVMEFAAGTTLASTDLGQLTNAQRGDLADRVIDAWLDMALDAGFFHGDPHAGNFIVDTSGPEPRLWLIDFGMTASLDASVRLMYARFLRCLLRDDTDGMVDILAELGVLLPGADLNGLKALAREVYSSLAHLNPRAFKGSRREQELSNKVAGFLRRARGIAFPRHTILLTRALGLVEGLVGELVPDESLLNLAKPRLRRLASPRLLARDLLRDARTRLKRLAGLPDRIEAALAARDSGKADITPLIAALALLAALQIPDPWRLWPTVFAGLALLGALLLRRSR